MRFAHWILRIACLAELSMLLLFPLYDSLRDPARRSARMKLSLATSVSLEKIAFPFEKQLEAAAAREGQIHFPAQYLADLAARVMPQAEFGPYELVLGTEKSVPLRGSYLEIAEVIDEKTARANDDLVVAAFCREDGSVMLGTIDGIALPYGIPQRPLHFVGLRYSALRELEESVWNRGFAI
jgi:hypothetical protein